MRNVCVLFMVLGFLVSCRKKSTEQPEPQPELILVASNDPSEAFLAGGASIDDATANAFGFQAPNLSSSGLADFSSGNSFFRDAWVIAPSSTSGRDGLGPMINASSCGACHTLDGRGKPHDELFRPSPALLFRLSVPGITEKGEGISDEHYGNQFQPRSIQGAKREGDVKIRYVESAGSYPDGTAYSLRTPYYSFDSLQFGNLESACMISPRIAQQLPGMGLLEAVSEQTLLSFADPADANGDGISGKPNYVWDFRQNGKRLGRFGWKANQPSISQQVAAAFNGDMGITSTLFSAEGLTEDQAKLFKDIPNGGVPEIDDKKWNQVTFYCATLAVPLRRNVVDPDVIAGKMLFAQTGCEKCHISKLKTGDYPFVPEFSNKTIKPFTDLLLHDMGEGLADHRPDFEATGSEWRTPPLWGIGLVKTVNRHTFFLHDGRARNLEEAILWHGGEGEKSKMAFTKLPVNQRKQLLAFLENL